MSINGKDNNHWHEVKSNQSKVNFSNCAFIADNERIPLLKALNESGLITRTHCYGHETGYSFLSILMRNDLRVEIRPAQENVADRGFDGKEQEILISWKRTD